MSVANAPFTSETMALIRRLEGITIDQVSWRTKTHLGEVTIYGTTDELILDVAQLRELADALESDDLQLLIDRSGAKARLTITD